MKFICRNAAITDIDKLVELHLSNFNDNELSIILGKNFIYEFYTLCLNRSDVLIRVIELGNGQLASSSAIFYKYSEFENRFRQKVKGTFIRTLFVFASHFKFKKIIFIFKTLFSRNLKTVINDSRIFDCYVGSFIIAKEYRHEPPIVMAAYKMLSANITTLKQFSFSGIWGSVRISNNASLRVIQSLGMNDISKVKSFPEEIYVCIWHKTKDNDKNSGNNS
jgi:hypothetical protein